MIVSLVFLGSVSTVSVLMYPGVTVFTVIPRLATSFANDFVKPMIAAFDAE